MRHAALAIALAAAAVTGATATAALAQNANAPAAKPAPAQPAPAKPALAKPLQPVELTGAARAQAITLASAALNEARVVKGRFLQTAPSGRASQGNFYLQRPWRLRFEYDAPSPLTIVSDGRVVSIEDRALKTVEQYPLRATPLYFVLKPQVNLDADGRVTNVVRNGDILEITLRDRKGQAEGAITLYFDMLSKELRQWLIIDGQGARTQVTLAGTQAVAALDPKLFVPKPMPKPGVARP